MSQNRNPNRSQNQIRVSDEIPICDEIRQMAENLQNNDFSNLIIARPLHPGTIMLGIAEDEIQIGDMVTFDHRRTTDTFHVRRLTQAEIENVQSSHSINTVESVGRARRHANIGEAIEFIIDQCCDYVVTQNPINAAEVFGGIVEPRKKHKLDEKYPHECYKCHKKLKYLEAWTEIKKTRMTEEKFQHLWELEQIEFYCCSCYDKEVRKEKGHTINVINTPFRNSDLFEEIRRRWSGPLGPSVLPSPHPAPIHIHTLNALKRYAEMLFGPRPIITRDWVAYNTQAEIPTYIEHRFDINVYGSSPHIHRRINMVVTVRNDSRFDDIPNPIELTIHSDFITTMGIAILVAELIFHWALAKVLFKREDEEWVELNELARENNLNRLLDEFIAQQNRPHERFHQTFPQFPHLFHLDDEHRQRCKLCGLTYLDLEMVNGLERPGVRGPRAGNIIYDGWHREYQLSMIELDEHEHEFNGHGVCIICNRTAVDIDQDNRPIRNRIENMFMRGRL